MKAYLKLLIFSVLVLSAIACSEDDGPSAPTYSIKVTNTTTQSVDVFLSAESGSFKKLGNIPSGEFREYDLELEVNYLLRASWEGDSADQHFSEQAVSNSNPDIISLNFDIFE